MDNFFNNEPKILKLIFTVRIYISYTCINIHVHLEKKLLI